MSQVLPDTISPALFAERSDAIADAARELAAAGWTPATSSNFSMRVDGDHAAITRRTRCVWRPAISGFTPISA